MATAQDRPEGSPPHGEAPVSRRVVIRGAFAIGLAGAAGLPLAACGDDSTNAAGAPVPEPAMASPEPARTIRPGSTKRPTSKSDVYQRGPEQRPGATPARAPEQTPVPGPTAGPSVAPVGSRGDDLATAQQGKGGKTGRPVATPTPAPLPPGAFARTSDIPVGGGKAFKNEKVVVTQPTAGQFKGFSATCTHTGCIVDKVEGGQIICPCHGSRFSIADGKVQKGPALLPLPAEGIAVSSDGAISRN